MTKNKIKQNLENPEELERWYRADRKAFEKEFLSEYPDIRGNKLADYWKVRLDFDSAVNGSKMFSRFDTAALVLSCAISAFLIKLSAFFNIGLDNYFFYHKNAGLIVLMGLSLYTILSRRNFNKRNVLISIFAFLLPAIYINLLPSIKESQSINLAYIHLPLLMWCVYGLIYTGYDTTDGTKRIDYVKYNGDLAILCAVILITGVILTGVTVGLFNAIGIKIQTLVKDYIAVWGLVCAPIAAAYIIRNYPFVSNKLAPIIANIFSPLVLVVLTIYLVTIPIAGKDPYNDRDFLLVFNLMLLGVMGIIVFSISETAVNTKQRFNQVTLLLLAIITLLINLIALSAIIYRLGEYGFTPNRTAVLGSNLLIFGNLILITIDLLKVNFRNAEIGKVEKTISGYLPVYAVWTVIVVFGFPLIFGMK